MPADAAVDTAALPRPPLNEPIALFVDVDGTLLEFANDPATVQVTRELRDVLTRLQRKFDGALALLSGRTVSDLGTLFQMPSLYLAGLHGLERHGGGKTWRAEPNAAIAQVRDDLRRSGVPADVLIEDKGDTIALHYRNAPQRQDAVHALANDLAQRHADLHLQHGNHVVEIRPAGENKGDALRAFMAQAPFAGRIPAMLGDDFTDEFAFDAAQSLGGFGAIVGPRRPTVARYALNDPPDALAWLAELASLE